MIAVPLFAVVLGTFLMFGLFLIADRKQEFWPASQASFAKVKENFWPWCGYFLLASVIGSLGQILCGIGMIITLPMTYCMIAVAYREAFAPEQAAASMAPAPEQPPLSPPAPPSAG